MSGTEPFLIAPAGIRTRVTGFLQLPAKMHCTKRKWLRKAGMIGRTTLQEPSFAQLAYKIGHLIKRI